MNKREVLAPILNLQRAIASKKRSWHSFNIVILKISGIYKCFKEQVHVKLHYSFYIVFV